MTSRVLTANGLAMPNFERRPTAMGTQLQLFSASWWANACLLPSASAERRKSDSAIHGNSSLVRSGPPYAPRALLACVEIEQPDVLELHGIAVILQLGRQQMRCFRLTGARLRLDLNVLVHNHSIV